jgi:hypothetical protein
MISPAFRFFDLQNSVFSCLMIKVTSSRESGKVPDLLGRQQRLIMGFVFPQKIMGVIK